MLDVNEFLDLCKERTNTVTDSNLARKLDVTRTTISHYRKGAIFPSDEVMYKMAKRAKLNLNDAMILLNYWRTGGAVQKHYKSMFSSLTKSS